MRPADAVDAHIEATGSLAGPIPITPFVIRMAGFALAAASGVCLLRPMLSRIRATLFCS